MDPWDDPVGYQSPGPQRGSDGPGSRGGAGSGKSSGGRTSRNLAVSAVVVVLIVIAAGAYTLIHKSSGSNAANGTTATVSPSTPTTAAKATATAKSRVTGSATTDGYALSTPSVAGGYPIGKDPDFLATATAAATTIEHTAVSGNGGTVTGKPVAASYTLADEQAIEFVGYQGTFNPKAVMTNLGSFGSSEATYGAGSTRRRDGLRKRSRDGDRRERRRLRLGHHDNSRRHRVLRPVRTRGTDHRPVQGRGRHGGPPLQRRNPQVLITKWAPAPRTS